MTEQKFVTHIREIGSFQALCGLKMPPSSVSQDMMHRIDAGQVPQFPPSAVTYCDDCKRNYADFQAVPES